MARLENQKKSENVVDRTGNGPLDNFLLRVVGALNPVTAASHVRDKLIQKGIIEPKVSDMFGHQNMKEWIDGVEKAVALKRITDNMSLVDPNVIFDSRYGDLIKPKEGSMMKTIPEMRRKE